MSRNERLDSDIDLGTKKLSGIVGGDTEDAEVLGYATIYTVGDAVIPRDWLLMRMDELGLPDYMAPPEPRPSSAYKRAARRLLDDSGVESAESNLEDFTDRDVEIELDNPEDADTYLRNVELQEFIGSEESGTEGGEYLHHHIGFITYDRDAKSPRYVSKVDSVDLEKSDLGQDTVENLWEIIVGRFRFLNDQMATHNLGDDILNHTLYKLTHSWTNTVVSLRDGGAVYFVPADLSDTVEALSDLLADINREYKEGGKRMALDTIPMVDDEQHREWIQQRVETMMEGAVDDLLDAAFEEFEDEDSTAEEIVRSIMNSMGDTVETAEQYNSLLQAEMSVEEILEEKKQELKDEKRQDIVERVLDQQTFDSDN